MSTIKKCTEVAANGAICQSPALRNNDRCFYHHRDQLRKVVFQQARQLKLSKDFADYPAKQEELNPEIMEALELPSLDDAAAIQVALTNVTRAVMSGHIDTKRAGLVLYALQIAAMNLRDAKLKPYASDSVTTEDADPIRPLYPVNCAFFPVPNHPAGAKPPKRDANSTLGNLPRNDFPSIGLTPHPVDEKVIRDRLAYVIPPESNGVVPDYFPYPAAKGDAKQAP